jgi:hypothetical protein
MEAKPQYEEEKQHSDGYPISWFVCPE